MGLGKTIRMRRLFSHPSGRFCSAAVDHYINYNDGMTMGLRRIKRTLASLAAGRPSAITMHKGIALSCWENYGGEVPLILQSIIARPDDSAWERVTTVEEAVRLGADAIAGAAFIRGRTEGAHLRAISTLVEEAARFDVPVVAHVYPRMLLDDGVLTNRTEFERGARISTAAEDIAWAVRCALEVGVDLIKVPYCGDVKAFADIVEDCPRPIVIAGGPQTATFRDALAMTREAVIAGAKGATIGRNLWSNLEVTAALRAFKAVIYELATPEEAIRTAGMSS